jgi:RNA polymerase sigma factor (sigma-70 family)
MKELKKYDTFENTLKAYHQYIVILCNKYNITQDNELFKDLYQEARIALYKSYIKYDINSTYTFHNYAVTTILNALYYYVNTFNSTIKKPVKLYRNKESINIISGDSLIDMDSNSTIFDLIPIIEEDTSIDDQDTAQRAAVMHYLDKLKESYQQIIKMHLIEEMTFEDISKELGVSRQAISQKYKIAINKLKMFYLNNNN